MVQGKIFVFSAPSGAGKNTLLSFLQERVNNLAYSISATTRPPRPHEINGVHYFFMSREEFTTRLAADEFAEWAEVYGHYYGTPKKYIDQTLASGRHIIMDIDVYGKKKFDLCYPQALGIFITPPSLSALEQRLRGRKSDSEEVIRRRLSQAKTEMEFARKEGKYEHTVINDDLTRAGEEVVRIVRQHIAEQRNA
jgi:guanylate kinase